MPSPLQELIRQEGATVIPYPLQLTYDNWTFGMQEIIMTALLHVLAERVQFINQNHLATMTRNHTHSTIRPNHEVNITS